MSDFDDQARGASERLRRHATEISRDVDRTTRVAVHATGSRSARSSGRWVLAVGAVAVIAAGLIGLVVIDRDRSTVITNDPSVPTSVSSSTATTASPTNTSTIAPIPSEPPNTTKSEPIATELTRPLVDPTVCESFTAIDGRPAGLPLYPSSSLPLTLFHRSSSLPVPIQIIGDPVDGPAKPFALIQREFDPETEPSGQEAVDINGAVVWLTEQSDGTSEAVWNLPDSSQGYLRSRGLDRDHVASILAALTPRPADHPIPGFDYATPGLAGLDLVAEHLNTDVTIGSRAGSQCRVPATGYVYRISAISGPAIYQFASAIDRPAPVDVKIIDGTVIIVAGPAHPTAPTTHDVVQADEAAWLELLAQPPDQRATTPSAAPIGDGLDVVVEFVPIDSTQPASSLALRLVEQDGVVFLQSDSSNAVIADGAQYWKIEINGRLRSRSTATAGGVHGIRLADSQLTTDFTVNISTTDGDDFTIQTTGDITLQPQP